MASMGAKDSAKVTRSSVECCAIGATRWQWRAVFSGDEIGDCTDSNSSSRSAAPAARCASPITSDNAPMPPATMAEYRMNWPSCRRSSCRRSRHVHPATDEHDRAENQQDRNHRQQCACTNAAHRGPECIFHGGAETADSIFSCVNACTVGIAFRFRLQAPMHRQPDPANRATVNARGGRTRRSATRPRSASPG
jgi:hypothetical protein